MKKLLLPVVGVFLCLALASCTVDSDNPLSPAKDAKPDKRLIGMWHDPKDGDTISFTLKKNGWMHIVDTPKPEPPGSNGIVVNGFKDYDAFITVIGKNTFLNVVMTPGQIDSNHLNKTYIFLRYTITGDHLQMQMLSPDAVAKVVRAGKLKGVITEEKSIGTNAPDTDVTLTGSTEDLAKFLQGTDINALFSVKLNSFQRDKTA